MKGAEPPKMTKKERFSIWHEISILYICCSFVVRLLFAFKTNNKRTTTVYQMKKRLSWQMSSICFF